MEKKKYIFTEEKDKYKYFTVENVMNFMDEHTRCPYTWSGIEFDVRFNFIYRKAKIASFYDEKNNSVNKLRIFADTKLGKQHVPCYLFVNDYTFKVVSCREYRGQYREEKTLDFSVEWCIDRLFEKGDEYKVALQKETEDKRMRIKDEVKEKVEKLDQEIQDIQNEGDDRMEEEDRRLGKIFDGAVRRKYAPGTVAMQVIEKNKQNTVVPYKSDVSNKDAIDLVYGEGYYENVIGEKTKNENKENGEKITHTVFGYDHDEVIGKGGK